MFKTEIKLIQEDGGEKIIPLKFTSRIEASIFDEGILDTEGKPKNPIKFIVYVVYFAALYATPQRDGGGITVEDIYDWIDQQPGGFESKELERVLKVYRSQKEHGVPVDAKSKGGNTGKK